MDLLDLLNLLNLLNRRRMTCAAIASGILAAGLLWRFAPLHLPPFLFKYGGSMLWAAMVYWIVAALLPRLRPRAVGVLAGLIAAMVELTRLYHAPALDAFRSTLAGRLILGKFFSVRNIAAYWLAAFVCAYVDRNRSRI